MYERDSLGSSIKFGESFLLIFPKVIDDEVHVLTSDRGSLVYKDELGYLLVWSIYNGRVIGNAVSVEDGSNKFKFTLMNAETPEVLAAIQDYNLPDDGDIVLLVSE